MARSIYTKEAAKLLRVALKNNFPGVKFSVRFEMYSMGSHINVSWTDGPNRREVEAVANFFSGSRFDGSNDSSYYVESWLLPNGNAVSATKDANGHRGGERIECPCEGAELVRFSGSAPSCNREISADYEAKAQAAWDKLDGRAQSDLINDFAFPAWEGVSYGKKLAVYSNAAKLPVPESAAFVLASAAVTN